MKLVVTYYGLVCVQFSSRRVLGPSVVEKRQTTNMMSSLCFTLGFSHVAQRTLGMVCHVKLKRNGVLYCSDVVCSHSCTAGDAVGVYPKCYAVKLAHYIGSYDARRS